MAELNNRHDPAWLRLPNNNDRSAWRPYGTPTLLIVPHRRDPIGQPVLNSDVSCIRVYVEDVPNASIVVGHQHLVEVYDKDSCGNQIGDKTHIENLRFPDKELYAVTLNRVELDAIRIAVDAVDYYRVVDGERQQVDYADAVEGDSFRYVSASGVTDSVPYLPDADYYDFSDVLLDVEALPSGRYVLVYQCEYFTRQRTTTSSGELLCIDTGSTSLAVSRSQFNHPGEVMGEFDRLTPSIYLTAVNRSQDTTLAQYRPLTDAMQDVYDEQSLLQQANWVNRIPTQFIPYLSTLLGWDFPYFPDSAGELQRVLLKNTSRLQTIKGSRQVVVEVFKLLGINALISNLWWSKDGARVIRPGEILESKYSDQQITVASASQIEPLFVDYRTDGVGGIDVPLLYRPQTMSGLDGFTASQDGGDVYITSYLVEVGSAAHTQLLSLSAAMVDDPAQFSASHQPSPPLHLPSTAGHLHEQDYISKQFLNYYFNQDGELVPVVKVDGLGAYGQVRVVKSLVSDVVGGPLGVAISQTALHVWADPAIVTAGVKFDRADNRLSIEFNGYQDFTGDYDLPGPRVPKALFAFASYTRQTMNVPDSIKDLQSNRFDIQLLQAETTPPLAGMYAYTNPQIMDFALEMLTKVKSFHSLLHAVRMVVELNESYSVNDLCVGGDVQQRYDTMMGQLQVPPAILPRVPTEGDCSHRDPESLGYKHADIVYRLQALSSLPMEHAAWKALDGRGGSEIYAVTGPRIGPTRPASGRDGCLFNPVGQDRILVQGKSELRSVQVGPDPNANQNTVNGEENPELSPVDSIDRGVFNSSGRATSINADGSAFGWFDRQYDAPLEPACELDGVTDYCFKGRPSDELLLRSALTHRETYRNKPQGLQLGAGVYWTYDSVSKAVLLGVKDPAPGSKTSRYVLAAEAKTAYGYNYKNTDTADGLRQSPYLNSPYDREPDYAKDSMLGRMYRSYGAPERETLHFANRNYPISWAQTANLALHRPSLDVELGTLHFPGCRLLRMSGLPANYQHISWKAKPWDDQYSSACGAAGSCRPEPTWLHARLTIDSHGDQTLEYDVTPYAAFGNGILPDVPALDSHAGGALDHDSIIHTVYSCAPAGHSAVSLDGVDHSSDQIMSVSDSLFSTSSDCLDTSNNAYKLDYVDGYPAQFGPTTWSGVGSNRNGVTFSTVAATPTFLLGDGVLEGTGHRLDATCIAAGCDHEDVAVPCTVMLPGMPCEADGDGLEMVPTLAFDESLAFNGGFLDGSIKSLFELLPPCPTGQLLPLHHGDAVRCVDLPEYSGA